MLSLSIPNNRYQTIAVERKSEMLLRALYRQAVDSAHWHGIVSRYKLRPGYLAGSWIHLGLT